MIRLFAAGALVGCLLTGGCASQAQVDAARQAAAEQDASNARIYALAQAGDPRAIRAVHISEEAHAAELQCEYEANSTASNIRGDVLWRNINGMMLANQCRDAAAARIRAENGL